jgi:hypothetical protein
MTAEWLAARTKLEVRHANARPDALQLRRCSLRRDQ